MRSLSSCQLAPLSVTPSLVSLSPQRCYLSAPSPSPRSKYLRWVFGDIVCKSGSYLSPKIILFNLLIFGSIIGSHRRAIVSRKQDFCGVRVEAIFIFLYYFLSTICHVSLFEVRLIYGFSFLKASNHTWIFRAPLENSVNSAINFLFI